jgi:sarcosine oxidase subunit gamma
MGDLAIRHFPAVHGTEWLKSLPPAARLAFYGGARAQAAALQVWGVAFSADACRAHAHATRATLWMGPDEYLLLDWTAGGAPSEGTSDDGRRSTAAIAGALEHALGDVPHALVDVSHRQFSLEVSGPHAATILNGACPLDLDLAEFPVGMCTRTVLAKADIVLWRTRESAFHLEIWRSFAGYVTGLLGEIASEFYPAH